MLLAFNLEIYKIGRGMSEEETESADAIDMCACRKKFFQAEHSGFLKGEGGGRHGVHEKCLV